MCLNEKANVTTEVRRIINNGFFTHHPFKNSSAQLEDNIKILNYLRALPEKDFHLCINAIDKTVSKTEFCPNCYGKGLVYLRLLSKGKDDELYDKYYQMYESFCCSNDRY